jgi:O-antigen ligase
LALIFFQAKGDLLTLSKRTELINNALIIFSHSPFFGVGLGNYLLAQNNFSSKFYLFFNQPVHNIFLLFLAEVGALFFILLFFFFISFLKKKSKKISFTPYFLLLTTIFFTGFFDHYWLTLVQNFFLMGVVFALKLF